MEAAWLPACMNQVLWLQDIESDWTQLTHKGRFIIHLGCLTVSKVQEGLEGRGSDCLGLSFPHLCSTRALPLASCFLCQDHSPSPPFLLLGKLLLVFKVSAQVCLKPGQYRQTEDLSLRKPLLQYWAPKSLQTMAVAMKLKDTGFWE